MEKEIQQAVSLEGYLQPETALERQLLKDDTFVKGLLWGTPRFGHPEGKVLYHVREVLDNVDRLNLTPSQREKLRLVTFVHDTFKYDEHRGSPRDWNRHHSILARQYLEQYTDDETVLDIIELHDEAYYCWRLSRIYSQKIQSSNRLQKLVNRLGDDIQLYYL